MRGGGCRHGSGVLPVRGSDRWAAAGGGGHGGGGRRWSATPRSATLRGRLYLPKWPGSAAGPYVPGSGERVPAELRLVLAGYVGIACGLFAGALACAAAFVFPFVLTDGHRPDDDWNDLLRAVVQLGRRGDCWGALAGLGLGLWRA